MKSVSKIIMATLAFSISLGANAETTQQYTVEATDNPSVVLSIGDYAPDELNRPSDAVTDWSAKGLAKPAYDTQWVRLNNRYVLIKIADDQIIDIVPITH